jgi:hypothetical protein
MALAIVSCSISLGRANPPPPGALRSLVDATTRPRPRRRRSSRTRPTALFGCGYPTRSQAHSDSTSRHLQDGGHLYVDCPPRDAAHPLPPALAGTSGHPGQSLLLRAAAGEAQALQLAQEVDETGTRALHLRADRRWPPDEHEHALQVESRSRIGARAAVLGDIRLLRHHGLHEPSSRRSMHEDDQ